ncbi:sodium/glutamate symporter [Oceanivirga miroungae]|uniref:Sodium/glutamate symporter n=1 Tax=Oceanivirga miroungae TaxID=1130046 RepID=A0A6I8M8G7_9FUSO|nr:sodium/glutamate symporter [Oceanivirga miroungae]VWL85761.1 sodium/glutamate symporter [Oceanivirga miroungae]
MITLNLDMIQSIGIAILFLLIGRKLRKKINILEKYSIPSPVVGGLIFAIIALILKENNIATFSFDMTLQNFFMTMFFTSVGFNASLKLLKQGGKKVVVFLIAASGLIFLQNILAIVLAKPLGIDPLVAFMTGSTSLTGGHGTSAAITSTLNNEKAFTVAITAATFGLIAGSILGGPIAKSLIEKKNLLARPEDTFEENIDILKDKKPYLDGDKFAKAFFTILLAMSIGTIFNLLFKKMGLNKLPYYLGPMIAAAIIRNLLDKYDKKEKVFDEITIVSDISLNLFLAMALINLKLWDLIDLAGPLIILLIAQVILAAVYVRYITFNMMGKDYDAAIIASGHIGFGMGATPNGITNMKTLCDKYRYSKIAFFTVPLVGALFIDFVNVTVITAFLSNLM